MKTDYTENGTMSSLYAILHLILIIHNIIHNTSTGQEIEAESGQLTCLISHSFSSVTLPHVQALNEE